jgi:hypothetical protein
MILIDDAEVAIGIAMMPQSAAGHESFVSAARGHVNFVGKTTVRSLQ